MLKNMNQSLSLQHGSKRCWKPTLRQNQYKHHIQEGEKVAPTHEQNSQVGDCKAEEKIVGGRVHTLVPEDISISFIIIFHLISPFL